MRDMFPEYYYKPDFEKLWEKAIFIFDANVLLDVYRFTPDTSKELLKILKHLKNRNRVWIPHQFADEYLRNLSTARNEIRERHRDKNELQSICKKMIDYLTQYDNKTDYDLKLHIKEIQGVFTKIKNGLDDFRKKHEIRLDSGDIENEIEELFADRIGKPYPDDRLAEIFSEGERRFTLGYPPGFKDSGKGESRRFGDLIGWLQIIDYAKGRGAKAPIIFVTRDSKDDWFYKPRRNGTHDGRIEGPRPELVKEMRDKTGAEFYIYQTGDFMKAASEYLQLDEPVANGAITEARKTRRVSNLEPLDWSQITAVLDYSQAFAHQYEEFTRKLAESIAESIKPDLSKLSLSKLRPQYDLSTLKLNYLPLNSQHLPSQIMPHITPSTDKSADDAEDAQESNIDDDG